MNSHTWLMALQLGQLENNATPSERAGFTEVLVSGMLMRWMSTKVRPMARPPNLPLA